MAEAKKNLMTYEGLQKLEAELEDLKTNKRKANSRDIAEAREQGDLSENAEYEAAKEEQRQIENRINEITKILKNAEIADDIVDKSIVNIGSTVTLLDLEYDEELTYKIVGSTEVNSLGGKISNESPVGAAILHHKAGETVTVETEAGSFKYKILSISHDE
ncbi:transcription elongation factor GreA [Shuttleworthella satelles]|uniref:Transcription elongation factor GreA n=1 Tax=Shuttleworthella satelles DSM 14600 TaxID=626523 RepID=C4GCW1_9FIRM|nr:transcription elongation factor GreA [Shuttleworthia satelles]EEP27811.1 prokaryotic transcription elongation factor, GreA/GreB domain protein [Shuttleworthia satelles DSM 14600]